MTKTNGFDDCSVQSKLSRALYTLSVVKNHFTEEKQIVDEMRRQL